MKNKMTEKYEQTGRQMGIERAAISNLPPESIIADLSELVAMPTYNRIIKGLYDGDAGHIEDLRSYVNATMEFRPYHNIFHARDATEEFARIGLMEGLS